MSILPSVTHSTSSLLPKRAQWKLLQSHLETASCSPLPAIPSWLVDIDKPVLLTLLAKLRSELDLLHSEVNRPPPPLRKDAEITLPGCHVGTPSPRHTSPSQATTSPAPAPNRAPGSLPAFRWANNTYKSIGKLNTSEDMTRGHRDDRFRLPNQLSPLSPTFGPRRGIVPTGTVERRRSSVPSNPVSSDGTSKSAENEARSSESRLNAGLDENLSSAVSGSKGVMKWLLWEAAWVEIEQNLEEWIGRFEGLSEQREKEEIWRQMIELKTNKVELQNGSALLKGYETAL